MLPVFFDWEDTCHVSKRDITFVFHNISQKVQILCLSVLLIFMDSEYAVPLVNNKNKRDLRLIKNRIQHSHKAPPLRQPDLFKFLCQFIQNIRLYQTQHILQPGRLTQKIRHIEVDHIVFI